jgi:hypothetical protein
VRLMVQIPPASSTWEATLSWLSMSVGLYDRHC